MLKLALAGLCLLLLFACGGGEGARGPDTESEAALARYREGEELFSNGQIGASIAAFTKAIRADPEFSDAYFDRGLAWLATKRWNDAIDDYDEALAIDPDRVPAYYNRAFAYSQIRRPQDAVSDYTEVVERDPENALAFANRGSMYIEMGLPGLALEDFDKAIGLDAELGKAYVGQAIAYSMLDMPTEAEAAIDASVERGYVAYNVNRIIERALAEYLVAGTVQ